MTKEPSNNEFWKNVATLLSAGVLAQAIPFLLLPILQKWFFGPSDFGVLAIYTSISLLLAGIASFKYELAIVNADTDTEAQHLLWGSSIIIILFTLFISIVLLLFGNAISSIFNAEQLGNYILLVPLSILFVGFSEVFTYWNNRNKKFKIIAGSKITKSIFAESSKLSFGKLNISNGLIFGRIIGELSTMLYLLINFLKKDASTFIKLDINKIKPILRKHYRFPTFSMPSVFVGNFINVVFIGLFSRYFGTESAGIIGVSVIYIAVAFGIMSQAFSQVFFKEIHQQKDNKLLMQFYLRNAAILSSISIVAIIIINLLPSQMVVYVLGSEWQDMLPTLKILVFAYGVQFVTSSLSYIYIRLNKQKTMLIFDIFHLALIWGSIIISYNYYGTFISAIIAYTIAQVLYYITAFVAAIIFIRRADLS